MSAKKKMARKARNKAKKVGKTSVKRGSGVGYNVLMTTADKVADYLLLKGQQSGKPITNKKLQKLLYYAQAWFVTLKNEKLFPETIEAWIHGPAIRSIYNEYKFFGFNPISKKLDSGKVIKALGSIDLTLLDLVWKVYGKRDAAYLEALTHSEDPWIQAREGLETSEGSSKEITTDSMKAFYSRKLDKKAA
ncbi:MAG: type II toxin-antitoxin system antitoxin SocA domain-containing protein [Candidatus Paceibacterota bacterium]|jgi:uncharacterized phage-associated protein